MDLFNQPDFDGADYKPEIDKARLTGQIKEIYSVMKDGKFRTVYQLSVMLGFPANSVQAQLRNLRKERFGGHTVQRRRKGLTNESEYCLIVNVEK